MNVIVENIILPWFLHFQKALSHYQPPIDSEYRLISLDIELNLYEQNKTGILEVDDEELQT